MRRILKQVFVGFVFLSSFFILPFEVSAHAVPVSFEPAAFAELDSPPQILQIKYTEPVDQNASSVEIFTSANLKIETQNAFVSEDDPHLLILNLPELEEDNYLVKWNVISKYDGHHTSGNYIFSLGEEIDQDFSTSLSQLGDKSLHQHVNFVDGFSTGIEMVGFAIVLGYIILRKLGIKKLNNKILYIGLFFSFLGIILFTIFKVNELSVVREVSLSNALDVYLQSTQSFFTLIKIICILLLTLLFYLSKKKLNKYFEYSIYFLIFILFFARCIISHAAASEFYPQLSVLINLIHLFGKLSWTGSALVFAYLILQGNYKEGLKALAVKYEKLTNISLLIGGLSGVYIVWLHLKSFDNVGTPWGSIFLILSMFAGLLLFSKLLNLHSLKKNTTDKLRANILVQGILALIIMIITGFMVTTSPPTERYSEYEKRVSQENFELILEKESNTENIIAHFHENGGEITDIKGLTLSLFEDYYGSSDLITELEEVDGGYLIKSNYFLKEGEWFLLFHAVREGSYDLHFETTINYPEEFVGSGIENQTKMNLFLGTMAISGIGIIGLFLFLKKYYRI